MKYSLRSLVAGGQIATGFVAGFAIWVAVAPAEAWDALDLYSVFVFAAGLLASFGRTREFYWGILGVYLGQVLAMEALLPKEGVPLMPSVIGVLIFGTMPAVVGAILGAGIGFCLSRVWRQKKESQ